MNDYIGLDVSMKETAVSIRRDGKRIWRGKCASDPKLITGLIRKHAPMVRAGRVRDRSIVGLVLSRTDGRGLAGDLHDARHAKAALDMAANKTGCERCGCGLAHLAEVLPFPGGAGQRSDSMLARRWWQHAPGWSE